MADYSGNDRDKIPSWPKKDDPDLGPTIPLDEEVYIIDYCLEALMRLPKPEDRRRAVRYLYERLNEGTADR